MKLETGKSYHLVYPKAPYPYLAKLVSVDIGTDETDDVILEFLLENEKEVPIKLAQIKSREVSIEPKDVRGKTKKSTTMLDAFERSSRMSKEINEMRAAASEKAAELGARTITVTDEVRFPKKKPQDQETEQANPHINE